MGELFIHNGDHLVPDPEIVMGELFIHNGDHLVPDPEVLEFARFDHNLYGEVEFDDRARFYQTIAKKLRMDAETLAFFYDKERRRKLDLRRELVFFCDKLDEVTRQLWQQERRNIELERENGELIEQVSGLATRLVKACMARDRFRALAHSWTVFGRAITFGIVILAYVYSSR